MGLKGSVDVSAFGKMQKCKCRMLNAKCREYEQNYEI